MFFETGGTEGTKLNTIKPDIITQKHRTQKN